VLVSTGWDGFVKRWRFQNSGVLEPVFELKSNPPPFVVENSDDDSVEVEDE
jgi:hypothetical protein